MEGKEVPEFSISKIIRPDGKECYLEVKPINISKDGVIVGARGVIRDITERKQLEQQLQQSQKMEAVGRLAGGIAHDFNNLLTVILGYSEMLASRIPKGDPLHKDVDEVKKSAVRAASLTKQLLAFSRKQVLQPRKLNLNVVVTETEKMLRRLIDENIELATVTSPMLGSVMADPGQIEQVIMNLVVNARDAMDGGGRLTIETANVVLDDNYVRLNPGSKPGHYAMLAVTDTGCGMDDETLSHLFEPFFTTKAPGKGTGLGLSTVYGIVKQSGGYISAYSEVNKGTTFKVYLPLVSGTAQTEKSDKTGKVIYNPTETILLAED
ncbi:MAG: ATP-binding protein, partial [candidate division Zixibacteria bacterium]|nr:ATP-binding protein [candidate division Zixibacteria bacterium]